MKTKLLPLLVVPMLCASAYLRSAQAAPFKSKQGYSLQAPAGWKVQSPGPMNADVILLATPRNGFSANLNVMAMPVPKNATLGAIKQQMGGFLAKMFTNFKIVGQSNIKLQGATALKTDATYSMGSPAKTMRMQQIIVLRNGKGYIFTTTSTAADTKIYQPRFKSILDSVRWTK